jgi:hypothetical protein
MTVTLQCSECGHRKTVTEATQDSAIELAAVYMKIDSYPPCSVCGEVAWKIVLPDNPMTREDL